MSYAMHAALCKSTGKVSQLMPGSKVCFDGLVQTEPGSPTRGQRNLEIKNNGSRVANLAGFLKSREGQLGLLSMAMLIFQGTALSLTLRFSR